jgi:hypothetical protein
MGIANMRILLLGCGGNAGINFVKSIKKNCSNAYIYGLDTNKYNVHLSNCDKFEVLNFQNVLDKIAYIKEIVKSNNIQFIHAQPDPEVTFLLENQECFTGLVFPLLKRDHELCSDKEIFQSLISEKLRLGYRSYNLTEVLRDPSLLDELKGSTGKIWFRAKTGAGSKAALPISDFEMLTAWSKYWKAKSNLINSDFQVCEYLPGREYAIQTFWINGELYHCQARERLVYFFGSLMPSGQSSTPAVAKVINEDEVYVLAKKAILAINENPHGIYCVDVKTDSNGMLIPTEINYGRFFTTSDFFSTIGVNTPYALAKYVISGEKPKIKINSLDSKYYWIRGLDVEPKLVSNI